jgi:UDP-N-acetyl-2-amino-2-deoxyglucuronate dehydrogenase
VPAMLDYESMLARPDVDAVMISVPHMLHAPLATQAARSGKHILLEKPMGVNLHDATQIVDSCRQEGVRLTVNFSFRYLPVIQLACQLVQEGALGDICGTQISHLMYKGPSYWAGGFTARSPSSWRGFKDKSGGGVLIMALCHAVDYLRLITGLEIKQAFSEYGTFASPVEVEDGIAVSYRYENGAVGSITASTCWRATPVQEVRIWGTHGSLVICDNSSLTFWSARRWREMAVAKEYRIYKLPDIDYTARWVQRFAMSLAADIPHEITGKDAWVNNAFIEAAYRSRDLNHPVDLTSYPWEEDP